MLIDKTGSSSLYCSNVSGLMSETVKTLIFFPPAAVCSLDCGPVLRGSDFKAVVLLSLTAG